MQTLSLLKDLSVFELNSGEQLGRVDDLSITNDGKVNGLLVANGGVIKRRRFLPIEQVVSFGENGVMVKNKSSLRQIDTINKKNNYTIFHYDRLFGKEVLSTGGKRLGLLEDVYFSQEVGTIIGYELTDGFFSDVTKGKQAIKTVHPPSIGKEAVIVKLEE